MGGKNNVKGHVAEKPSGGLPPGSRVDQIKNLIGNAEYVAARMAEDLMEANTGEIGKQILQNKSHCLLIFSFY